MKRRVLDTFDITGRGLVVMLEGTTRLVIGRPHPVIVKRADDVELHVNAFKEWLRRATPTPDEAECFLLPGLSKDDVPIGCTVLFTDTRSGNQES